MARFFFSILIHLIFIGSFCGMAAVQQKEPGTLVVSYQTGPKGERLNRVRFLLINDAQQEQMFPKGDSFIEDEEKLKRLVAIEDVPAGNYQIKFLIPNTDGLFEEIPEKHISIEPGESLKIDQTIKPRYVSLKAMSTIIPKDKKPATAPTITLRDHLGEISAQSTTGKMIAHFLKPGNYTLIFEPLPGFITPAPISFAALPGRTVGVLAGTYRWLGEPVQSPTNEVAESVVSRPNTPNGPIIINQVNAQLSVTTNMPQARWTLLKNNVSVYLGRGSIVNYQLPEGDNFRITAEELEGYNVRINPPYPFRLYTGQTMRAEIIYERTYGSISVDAPFPDGESIVITTTHKQTRTSKTFTVKSRNGKIYWLSPQIPTGAYVISYQLPKEYETVPSEEIFIHQGERLRLSPKLFITGSLRLLANIPEAVFTVKSTADGNLWQGEGREYQLRGLPGGIYLVSFTSKNTDYYIAPADMRLVLSGKENKEVKVIFQIGGLVTIRSNMDRNAVTIESLTDQKKVYKDAIYEQKKSFTLPEGRYRITMTPLQNSNLSSLKLKNPEPVENEENSLTKQTVDLPYSVEQQEVSNPLSTLSISTNISAATFTVTRVLDKSNEVVGNYIGKDAQINLAPGKYLVIFSDVPNYKTPEPIELSMIKGKSETLQAVYEVSQQLVTIPAGKAIIGNATSNAEIKQNTAAIANLKAFAIGIYEVTNAQFASWLNEALQKHTIAYVAEADNQGQVLDLQGRLLFKTFDADPYSQITIQRLQHDTITFTALPGKEQYPVIDVSWYGAMAYSRDVGARLPTEAEWEKAAGMAPENPNGQLKKFIYGFGSDEITSSWANYKTTDHPIQYFQVLTTPVGFYNGTNPMPLTANDKHQRKTHLAKSPYGAYDMSGNVWEWVADWYSDGYIANINNGDLKGPLTGTTKVVKGGCYDSLAEGVRVTERLSLDPEHTDAYTGFRIAKDL